MRNPCVVRYGRHLLDLVVQLYVERTIASSPERVFDWLVDPANLTAAPLVLRAGWAKGSSDHPGVGALRAQLEQLSDRIQPLSARLGLCAPSAAHPIDQRPRLCGNGRLEVLVQPSIEHMFEY